MVFHVYEFWRPDFLDFFAISAAATLSIWMVLGCMPIPISRMIYLIHIPRTAASASVLYSDVIVEPGTTGYSLEY